MKIYPSIKPSLKELHEAAQDRAISVSYTPAGPVEGTAYTKRAVPWKKLRAPGLFGGKVARPASAAEREALLAELRLHGNLLEGLKKCVGISKKHAGVLGWAVWEVAGIVRAGPMKAFKQAESQGKPVRLSATRPGISRVMKAIPSYVAAAPSVEPIGVPA